MDSHNDEPTQPDRSEQPTEPQADQPRREEAPPASGPQSPAGAAPPGGGDTPPRRLTRSSDDRMVAGVAGGIARYFGIDATLVRIGIIALVLFGGAGVLLYLAGLVLMPSEAGGGGVAPRTGQRPGALTVIGAVVLALLFGPLLLGGGFLLAGLAMPLAIVALVGLLVWWLVSGEGPSGSAGEIAKHAALGVGVLILCCVIAAGGGLAAGLGGGSVVAALVILAGVMLVAGAFIGGVRWLILPALSLALAVGFVSAAGIDLDGGVGEREYKPTSASAVRDGYRVGMGELVVDLRDADLPKGDTRLNMDVGIGAARLIVPEDVCVASAAEIGIGAVDLFDRENGGVDVDWDERPPAASGNSRVVVDADIGVGALLVRHDRSDDFDGGPHFGHGFDEDEHDDEADEDDGTDQLGNAGCRETRAAR